jgi:rhamnosyltransferase subunit B
VCSSDLPSGKEELRRAMDRRTGTEYILRDLAFGRVRETFDDCRDAARGADLIVTHSVAFGSLLVARATAS